MDLKEAMRQAGLSNEGLESISGVNSSRIAAYKSGGRTMSAKTAQRLAPHVDADPENLTFTNRQLRLERCMKRGDRAGVYKAMKSILGTAEKHALSDEGAVDDLLDRAVKFLQETPAPGAGYGLEDDHLSDDGRDVLGRKLKQRAHDLADDPELDEDFVRGVIPEFFEDDNDVDDEGRDARGIRVRPMKETR